MNDHNGHSAGVKTRRRGEVAQASKLAPSATGGIIAGNGCGNRRDGVKQARNDKRCLNRAQLQAALVEARQDTNALLDDLSDAQCVVPQQSIVNPFLWEYGHVGWFMENFCLRWQGTNAPRRSSLLADADRWFDSSNVAHDTRWSLDLPDRAAISVYIAQVLESTLQALARADDSDDGLYLFRLALYHEDMHAEAFTYMRHTVGLPKPSRLIGDGPSPATRGTGDSTVAGGVYVLGAPTAPGFVFDNEKWAHEVRIAPFAIATQLTTCAEFAAFIDDGGYSRSELWSREGQAWLLATQRTGPRDWRRGDGDGDWQERFYDRWRPVRAQAPVQHVTAHEAEAYCRWAKRRLPTEAEWELAASSAAISPLGLWEWTASSFAPYPGFSADAYADYSQPWFHTHRVLRGASFATPARLVHTRFRNFFLAERDDIFVGFRTCAVS